MFDTGVTQLGSIDIGEAGGSLSSTFGLGFTYENFIAPSDGFLLVEVAACNPQGGSGCSTPTLGEGGGGRQYAVAPYTVTLSPNASVPEPSTLGGVGIGLSAIALAWRRRRAS
jgi:hypothetical protein